jgi:hypothetical protein
VKLRERSVRRFSKVATAAVVTLASTGLYAILLHVPCLQALVTTPYGRAFLVKLGLLTFVLAIGAANFLLRGRGPIGRLVVIELLLALGVFIATGFLPSLLPASTTQHARGRLGSCYSPNHVEGVFSKPQAVGSTHLPAVIATLTTA